MMKTRRRSKAVAAAAGTSTEDSQQAEGSHSYAVVIPEDLDFDALSSLIPDLDLSTPNSDTIVSVYRLLVQQATELSATQRELDESRAEVEKKDVELDQALQDRESASKDLEQTLESAQVELEKYKQERDQLGMSSLLYAYRMTDYIFKPIRNLP